MQLAAANKKIAMLEARTCKYEAKDDEDVADEEGTELSSQKHELAQLEAYLAATKDFDNPTVKEQRAEHQARVLQLREALRAAKPLPARMHQVATRLAKAEKVVAKRKGRYHQPGAAAQRRFGGPGNDAP